MSTCIILFIQAPRGDKRLRITNWDIQNIDIYTCIYLSLPSLPQPETSVLSIPVDGTLGYGWVMSSIKLRFINGSLMWSPSCLSAHIGQQILCSMAQRVVNGVRMLTPTHGGCCDDLVSHYSTPRFLRWSDLGGCLNPHVSVATPRSCKAKNLPLVISPIIPPNQSEIFWLTPKIINWLHDVLNPG